MHTEESIILQSITISNIYEKFKSKPDYVAYYLNTESLSWDDLLAFSNLLDTEIEKIEDIENEYCYEKQIKESFTITPKDYELAFDRDSIKTILEMEEIEVEIVPGEALKIIREATISSYKFQLKYCKASIEAIMSTTSIWECAKSLRGLNSY